MGQQAHCLNMHLFDVLDWIRSQYDAKTSKRRLSNKLVGPSNGASNSRQILQFINLERSYAVNNGGRACRARLIQDQFVKQHSYGVPTDDCTLANAAVCWTVVPMVFERGTIRGRLSDTASAIASTSESHNW